MSLSKFLGFSSVCILGFATSVSARQVEKLTRISFLNQWSCQENSPCFRITPDSKGVAVINSQRHLTYQAVGSAQRFKIAEIGCVGKQCFDFSGDSQWVAYSQIEGTEVRLYARSLADLRTNKVDSPLKLGTLPHFEKNVGVQNHELNFCGSPTTLYVRIGTDLASQVWSYHLSDGDFVAKKLFAEAGGSTGPLRCAENGHGVYFSARLPTADGLSQEERVVYAADQDSTRVEVEPAILFRETVSVGERLIADFSPALGQLLVSLRSPSWVSERSGSIVSYGENKSENILSYAQSKSFKFLNIRSGYALVTSFDELMQSVSSGLASISLANGEQMSLLADGLNLDSGQLNGGVSLAGDRVLFFESNYQKRNLSLARIGGAQRQTLYSQSFVEPFSRYNVTRAKLSPTGTCALLTKDSSPKHAGQRAELIVLDSEQKTDIFPLAANPDDRWTQPSRMGFFELAPDSSFAVVLADLDGTSHFDLYEISLPECAQ